MQLELFIKRPVLAATLGLFIAIAGLIAYFILPVRLFPLVPASYITVTTTYPGASPETMEGFVSTPIEEALTGIDGIDYISTANTPGTSIVTLKFFLEKDSLDKALPQVTNRVSSVMWQLPTGINSPIITKVDPNGGPGQAIMYYGFGSEVLTREQVTDYLTRVVRPQVEALSGVSTGGIYGGRDYAMRIWIDPKKLAAYHMAAGDVYQALQNQNLQATAGQLRGAQLQFDVQADTDLHTPDQFNNIAIRGGEHPIRIKDIGYAELGASTDNISAYLMGDPAVVLGVEIQDDANAIEVSDEVRQLVTKVRQQLPPGMWMKLLADMTDFNRASIHEVHITILEASTLVFLVILAFLGSFRSVAIPVVTIPLSLFGGSLLMWAFGFSNNTLTLLAWVLAIGLVVDDAIVVLENIHRHMEEGATRLQAALESITEIKSAIVVMTLAVAIVFIPIGFIPGISGALFGEFAYTMAMVVLISGLLALTLTPVMCTRILPSKSQITKFQHIVDTGFGKFRNMYTHVLDQVLHMRWIVGIIFVALMGAGYYLMHITPEELIPAEDTGVIIGIGLAPPGANIHYIEKYSKAFENVYESIPEMQSYGIFNGWPAGANQVVSFLEVMSSDGKAKMPNEDKILGNVMQKMMHVSGLFSFAIKRPVIPGEALDPPVEFVIKTSADYQELSKAMEDLEQAAATYPGIIAPHVNMKMQQVQINVDIDRAKASALGIKAKSIADTLAMFYAQPIAQWFNYSGRSYEVIPQVFRSFHMNPNNINLAYVRTEQGNLVPLSSVAKIHTSMTPNTLNQFEQMHSATLSAQVAPGYTLGEALTFLQNYTHNHLGPNFKYDYKEESRQFVQSQGVLLMAFLVAIALIYLMLTAFFDSFREPFIVMLSVPLAVVGALYIMYLTGVTLNIYTKIGLIMLVGLISKHGILIVHFANKQQELHGEDPRTAVLNAASIRLRPILMTTTAMIAGSLPLVFASGAGALARQNIGWVTVGGMALGTFLTLFVVPTAYTLFAAHYHGHKE